MKISSISGRRRFLGSVGALGLGVAAPAFAQVPALSRGPVRFILPLSAGGAADASTRPLAVELEKSLGRPVIVENKPGGLFTIGMQALLQSPADGHTLLYLYNSVASVQAVHKRFDINRQLLPLAQTTSMPMVLLVPGSSRFKTIQDLVAHGRSNPGALNYSTLGQGSTEHLKAVQLCRAAGIQAQDIPYKSGPEMLTGLIGGEVSFTLTAGSFARIFAPKGQVRVLAVIDRQRAAEFPDVPTLAEGGVSIPPLNFWGGYAVHASTPPATAQMLFEELAAAATKPGVRDLLAPLGIVPTVSKSPQDFRKLIADDVAWMTEIAKDLNITPDKG